MKQDSSLSPEMQKRMADNQATAMDNALYDLSRFMRKFNRLGSLLERNEEMPAFRMAISNDDDVDSI